MLEYERRHLQGHIQYYGVSGNTRSLRQYQQNADPIWLHQNDRWEYMKGEGEEYETDAEDMDKL